MLEEPATEIIGSSDTVYLVFLDFSRLFDTANRRFLVQKLKAYGIYDIVVNKIESFLKKNTFTVSIN